MTVGLALVAVVACSSPPSEAPAPPARLPDVVLVTLDTTRADRIGAYGYADAHTETIDALAKAGRRYARAYSPLPLTIPAHSALFTSDWPPRTGVRSNGDAKLPDTAVTLAERLKGAGYTTAAAVSAFVTTRQWGFDQGFDVYLDEIPTDGDFWHAERPGRVTVDEALAWREKQPADGGPLFLWVHLYDAHFPYAPESPWREVAPDRPYDGEIATLDDQVQRLVDAFAGRPTLFAVVGDHGEGLGDHGELNHGLFVYEATQHVPFVLSGPGVPAGDVVDQPVSLVDVGPTILSTLGLPVPGDVDGRPVPGTPPRPLYVETYQLRDRFGVAPHVGVVDGPLKLVDVPKPELYDVVADPAEANDLATSRPEDVARLQRELAAFGFSAPTEAGAPEDADAAEQLAALGYVDGTFTGDKTGPLPDPKDEKRMIGLAQRADRLREEGKPEEAEQVLATLMTEHPDVLEFANRRATLLVSLGRDDEAKALVDAGLKDHPDNFALRMIEAGWLARHGRFEEASAVYKDVAKAQPYMASARLGAVTTLLSDPKLADDGLLLGEQYLAAWPDDASLAGVLGVAYYDRHQPERALPLLEHGLDARKPERDVAYCLASLERGRGDAPRAKALLADEVSRYPNNRRAAKALLREASDQKDWTEVARTAGVLIQQDPSDPVDWHARAQALFNLGSYQEAREALDPALKRFPGDPNLLLLDANLLEKEGKHEEAVATFEKAKRSRR